MASHIYWTLKGWVLGGSLLYSGFVVIVFQIQLLGNGRSIASAAPCCWRAQLGHSSPLSTIPCYPQRYMIFTTALKAVFVGKSNTCWSIPLQNMKVKSPWLCLYLRGCGKVGVQLCWTIAHRVIVAHPDCVRIWEQMQVACRFRTFFQVCETIYYIHIVHDLL